MCARLTQREMTKERDKARVGQMGASEEENIYTEGRNGWSRERARIWKMWRVARNDERGTERRE